MNKTDIVKEYGTDLRLSNFTAAEIRFSSLANADLRGAYFIKASGPLARTLLPSTQLPLWPLLLCALSTRAALAVSAFCFVPEAANSQSPGCTAADRPIANPRIGHDASALPCYPGRCAGRGLQRS